ncbi:unnamed protein product [Rotaria magnacalcarata]|uniref:UDP-glucose/GDP-mannose dehydrogenase C-terminal domain-containing protein n=1 Tax=Rotaria magnacalcarata TaxID=392030 RepID=A0A820Y8G1_9BILA|nr:unnamed protein product [Rotaria magnacalcarata]
MKQNVRQIFDHENKKIHVTIFLSMLNHVHIANERYAAAKDSHAIVVCTEWDEFIRLDYELIYSTMQKPSYIFDGRLILDHDQLMSIGFNVFCIGKKTPKNQFLT